VGHDFGEYESLLSTHGVDTSGLLTVDQEFTASCFINTDQANNQIVAFYTGAMSHARSISLHGRGLGANDLVLISASDPESMHRFAVECQELGIPYVFDAGKQTPRLEPEQLRVGIAGARVLIGNDYEFGMMAKAVNMSEEALIASAPLCVITRGKEGSTLYRGEASSDQSVSIPVVPIADVRDPTGAGDAYLAGLVFGLSRDLPLEVTGRIAALSAAYAVEMQGCQEHRYTPAEFAARYAKVFGPNELVQKIATTS
jgi:adenosine kinase